MLKVLAYEYVQDDEDEDAHEDEWELLELHKTSNRYFGYYY